MNQSGFLPNELLIELRDEFTNIFEPNNNDGANGVQLPNIHNTKNNYEYTGKLKNVMTLLDRITYNTIISKNPSINAHEKKSIYFPINVNKLSQYRKLYPKSFPQKVFDAFAKCTAELPSQIRDISKDVHRRLLTFSQVEDKQVIPSNNIINNQGPVRILSAELHLTTIKTYYNSENVTGLLPQCYKIINELLNALEQT